MIRAILFVFVMVYSICAWGSAPEWICTSASSVYRSEFDILSCGMAVAGTEAEARSLALDRAIEEWRDICHASSRCSKNIHLAQVVPGRTQCMMENNLHKCIRAINVTMYSPGEGRFDDIYKKNDSLEFRLGVSAASGGVTPNTRALYLVDGSFCYKNICFGAEAGGPKVLALLSYRLNMVFFDGYIGSSAFGGGVGIEYRDRYFGVFTRVSVKKWYQNTSPLTDFHLGFRLYIK